MSIQVQCGNPACGKVHRFKNRYAGMTGRCPDCGTPITVPKLAVPVPAPAAPEPALQAAPSAPPPPISPAPALQGVADDEIDFSALMEEDTPAAEAAEEAPAALTAQDEAEIAEMAEMAEVAEAEEPAPAAAETPRPTNGEEAKARPRLALDDEAEVAEVAELGEVVEEAEAAEVAEAAPEAGTPPGANGPGKQLRPLLSPPDEAEVAEVAEIAEGEDVEEAEVAEAEEAEEVKPARGASRLNLLAAIFFGVGVLCLIALGFTIYLESSPARTTIGKNHTVVAVGPVSGIVFTCISLGVGLFAGICLAVALVFRRRAVELLMLGAGYLAYVWSGLVFVFCLALVWGALAAPKNAPGAGPPPGRGGMQGGRPGVPGGGMRGGQPGGQPGGAGGQPGGAQLSPPAPNLPRHVDLTPGTDEWASLVVSAVCLICFWVGMFRLHNWKMLFILLLGVGVVLGGFLLFVMEPWKGPMGTQVFG